MENFTTPQRRTQSFPHSNRMTTTTGNLYFWKRVTEGSFHMGSRLNIIAGTLFLIWLIEFFGYNAGQNIHILLLFSIIIMLTKTLSRLPNVRTRLRFEED